MEAVLSLHLPHLPSGLGITKASCSYGNDKGEREKLENCIAPHITLTKISDRVKSKDKNRIAKSHDKKYGYWEEGRTGANKTTIIT